MINQDYLPRGPSDSSKVRDFAAEQSRYLKENEDMMDKTKCMKYLQDLTNRIVGVPEKPLPPPTNLLRMENLVVSSPPIFQTPLYITSEMRQPSMHQLDTMKSIRQRMESQLPGRPLYSNAPYSLVTPYQSNLTRPVVSDNITTYPNFVPDVKKQNVESVPATTSNVPINQVTIPAVVETRPQNIIESVESDSSDDDENYDESDSESEVDDSIRVDSQSLLPGTNINQSVELPIYPNNTAKETNNISNESVIRSAVPSESSVKQPSAVDESAVKYTRMLEKLLADKEAELLELRRKDQLVQQPPVIHSAAPSSSPAPQQQHIHIHNHFSGSDASSRHIQNEPSAVLYPTKADNNVKSSSVNTQTSNENDVQIINNMNRRPTEQKDGIVYPYEKPIFDFKPLPKAESSPVVVVPSPAAAATIANTSNVYVEPKNFILGGSIPTGKGAAQTERALDLSGMSLERLRELTGHY